MAPPSRQGAVYVRLGETDVDAAARALAEMKQAMVERDRYRQALEKLADPSAWGRYERPHRYTVKFAREALSA